MERTLLDAHGKKIKRMARATFDGPRVSQKKKRPGVHSKNASRGQSSYKQKYRGQGR